jgi:hypothetical protein
MTKVYTAVVTAEGRRGDSSIRLGVMGRNRFERQRRLPSTAELGGAMSGLTKM